MLAAGLHDFSRETLSDFQGLGNAAPFRDQSRNIRTGTQIAPVFQASNPDADRDFIYFGEMYLALHYVRILPCTSGPHDAMCSAR